MVSWLEAANAIRMESLESKSPEDPVVFASRVVENGWQGGDINHLD